MTQMAQTDSAIDSLHRRPTFAQQLEAWYHPIHRRLPWRETKDIYAIWLSEIMLQQTQVATVLPYYDRFLKRFPTVQTLADASIDELLKYWEGLGYYSRARNLHKAAQHIVNEHKGQFPLSIEAVEALPGIGRSTAGAILTFGASQRHPILDGNVKRVLARLFDVAELPAKPSVTREMWGMSKALLSDSEDPFTFNQAIMELGATVCLPSKPKCLLCPVSDLCEARQAGTVEERPVKAPKKTTPHHAIGVGVLQNEEGLFLIQKRPSKGLLAGLWEFPGGKQEAGETIQNTIVRELQEELGITVEVGPHIIDVPHAYSHFKVTLHTYLCTLVEGKPVPKVADELQWVSLEAMEALAFPKANNHIIKALKHAGQ